MAFISFLNKDINISKIAYVGPEIDGTFTIGFIDQEKMPIYSDAVTTASAKRSTLVSAIAAESGQTFISVLNYEFNYINIEYVTSVVRDSVFGIIFKEYKTLYIYGDAVTSAASKRAALMSAIAAADVPPVNSLADLSDVTLSTPTNGQVLTYDATNSEWKNAGGGTEVVFYMSNVSSKAIFDNANYFASITKIEQAIKDPTYSYVYGAFEMGGTSSPYPVGFLSSLKTGTLHRNNLRNAGFEVMPDGFLSNFIEGDLSELLYSQADLTQLPTGFLSKMVRGNLQYLLRNCEQLTDLPAGFLSKFENGNLEGIFMGTPISSLPAGFLSKFKYGNLNGLFFLTLAPTLSALNSDFLAEFEGGSVDGMFGRGCSELVSIPVGLLDRLITKGISICGYNEGVVDHLSLFSAGRNNSSGCAIFPITSNMITVTSVPAGYKFDYLFKGVGVSNTGANIGTAPELWNLLDANGDAVSGVGCFAGHSANTLTNYADIPADWK